MGITRQLGKVMIFAFCKRGLIKDEIGKKGPDLPIILLMNLEMVYRMTERHHPLPLLPSKKNSRGKCSGVHEEYFFGRWFRTNPSG
jgi:hypothetical protein